MVLGMKMKNITQGARYQLSNCLTHEHFKECVNDFFSATLEARYFSERCRDYYDGRQWSAEQIEALRRRKQAPIVNNRIKVKLNGLLGLISVRKGDPKAYPRNVDADSGAAEAVTDGLRYVADKNNLNSSFLECADSFFCEGYCGLHVTAEEGNGGEYKININTIPWDRIIFDPYSRKHDFSDARGLGFGVWVEESELRLMFPDAPENVFTTEEPADDTFSERNRWYVGYKNRRRVFTVTYYTKKAGEWYVTIFTGGGS